MKIKNTLWTSFSTRPFTLKPPNQQLAVKISTKNHWCPQFLLFSTLCMRSMFLQVDANGLHENGDILPAIILLRVKTACPEKALNLLRGKMQARKKNPSRRQYLEQRILRLKIFENCPGYSGVRLSSYTYYISPM